MQYVVLDTNAILMPFEIRMNIDLAIADLIGDAKIAVPGPMIGELKHLKHKYAGAALELARKYEIIQTSTTGDDAVVEAALKTGGFVLTNDKELRARLRKMRIPMIYLRSGHHLIAETFK